VLQRIDDHIAENLSPPIDGIHRVCFAVAFARPFTIRFFDSGIHQFATDHSKQKVARSSRAGRTFNSISYRRLKSCLFFGVPMMWQIEEG
jgi:hypothetical protein